MSIETVLKNGKEKHKLLRHRHIDLKSSDKKQVLEVSKSTIMTKYSMDEVMFQSKILDKLKEMTAPIG